MKKCRLILGIALFCFVLPLAGPSNVSALPATLESCTLNVGVTCVLTPVTFSDGGSNSAKVAISVEAIDLPKTSPNTTLIEFEYRYQIFEILGIAVTEFLLLDIFPEDTVLAAGFIPDAVPDPNTIAPTFAGYEGNPNFRYRAMFAGITPGSSSNVLFIRTTTEPNPVPDVGAQVAGPVLFFPFGAFLEGDLITGPGTTVTLSAQHAQAPIPEPSTLILLGSGLLGIVGARLCQE